MTDVPALHALTVRFMPTQPEPIVVWPHCDPLTPALLVGLLRAAAAHLAQTHGLDGRECLEEFLTTYPQPEGVPTP